MATYAADIRVKVNGLPELTKLGDKLAKITKQAKLLNEQLQKIKRAIKAPTITVNTNRALADIQKVNKELDKLNNRKVNPQVGGPAQRSGGGSGPWDGTKVSRVGGGRFFRLRGARNHAKSN